MKELQKPLLSGPISSPTSSGGSRSPAGGDQDNGKIGSLPAETNSSNIPMMSPPFLDSRSKPTATTAGTSRGGVDFLGSRSRPTATKAGTSRGGVESADEFAGAWSAYDGVAALTDQLAKSLRSTAAQLEAVVALIMAAGPGTSSVDSSVGMETPDEDAMGLIDRADEFTRTWSAHGGLAAPADKLTEALRSFVTADNSRAHTAAQLKAAAAALTTAASNGKLPTEAAKAAKQLALDAGKLVFDEQDQRLSSHQPSSSSSGDNYLYCLSISGALALLPSLPSQVPKEHQKLVAISSAVMFSVASCGAMLSIQADGIDLKIVKILGQVSFGAFVVLVVACVSCSLAPEIARWLTIESAVLVFVWYIYVWCKTRKRSGKHQLLVPARIGRTEPNADIV